MIYSATFNSWPIMVSHSHTALVYKRNVRSENWAGARDVQRDWSTEPSPWLTVAKKKCKQTACCHSPEIICLKLLRSISNNRTICRPRAARACCLGQRRGHIEIQTYRNLTRNHGFRSAMLCFETTSPPASGCWWSTARTPTRGHSQ